VQSAEVKTLSTGGGGGGGGLGLSDGWSNRVVIEKDLRHRNEPDFVPAFFFVLLCFRTAGLGCRLQQVGRLRVGGGSWCMGLDSSSMIL